VHIAHRYGDKSQSAFPSRHAINKIAAVAGQINRGRGQTAKMAKGDHDMFKSSNNSHPLLAALTIAGVFAAAPAFAGECPADKMKPNVREKVDYKPVGVTDVTLGSINLEKQPANIRPISRIASCASAS
jgi:hypothetical protein